MPRRLPTLLLFAGICLLSAAKLGLNIAAGNKPEGTEIVATVQEPRQQAEASPPVPEPPATPAHSFPDYFRFLPDVIASARAETVPAGTPATRAISENDLQSIRDIRKQLDERRHEIEEREATLASAEKRLNRRIDELQQLETTIRQRLQDEKNIKNKKIKRLTAVYEGMKPERAAPIIDQLKLATVVKVFLLMDEKKVGKILSFLPPEKAVQISQALTSRISSIQ